MSRPTAFVPLAIASVLFLSGCTWLIDFVPYQQCPERPILIALVEEPQVYVTDPPTFRSTAGCTIVFEVRHLSHDGISWDPLTDKEYEVRVEPVEPDGRIETGVLGAGGRVTVQTDVGHTAVTITVFLPEDREPDGIQEETAIVYLDPPSE